MVLSPALFTTRPGPLGANGVLGISRAIRAGMKVLITSSRMPFAVEEIRKLGQEGHTVFAADTYELAPGNYSKYAEGHYKIPAPRQDADGFARRVAEICEERAIDLVVPTFEESIYLSQRRRLLPRTTRLFAPTWSQLVRLHKKSSFSRFAARLGLPVPPTHVVWNEHQMRIRMRQLGDYFARPVCSRGATLLLSNHAIERGGAALSECSISPQAPWVIQPYVPGPEICSYSIARKGRLVAHVTYSHPRTLGDRGGIAFEAIDSSRTLPAAQTIAEATHYTGQFGLDFIDSKQGLFLAECNARATSGVGLIPADVFSRCLDVDEPQELYVAPPGARRQITSGLLLDTLQHPSHLSANVKAFFDFGDDVYSAGRDLAPALCSLLSFAHTRHYQKEMPQEAKFGFSDVVNSQFYDICWQQN